MISKALFWWTKNEDIQKIRNIFLNYRWTQQHAYIKHLTQFAWDSTESMFKIEIFISLFTVAKANKNYSLSSLIAPFS